MQCGELVANDLELQPPTGDGSPGVELLPSVGVVEDDPVVAALAVELCRGLGATAVLFSSATPFLQAFSHAPPRAVVLDWRLEREVGAAAFMAIRHRFPLLPVVCWTASPPDGLPAMIHRDPLTRVVEKGDGLAAFETALSWALGTSSGDGPEPSVTNGHG
jgi:CheY-like chemotaxis protein